MYDTLVSGDWHIKDFPHGNSKFGRWQQEMFQAMFLRVNEIIKENKNITKLVLAGDIFDYAPKGEALILFHNFMSNVPSQIRSIEMFAGNHCLLGGINQRLYYIDIMKHYFEKLYPRLKIKSFEQVDDILYCSHQHIEKLERLDKKCKIVYSHFRALLGAKIVDEIDTTMLKQYAGLSINGDIHFRAQEDNIIYTGSPIDTHFDYKFNQIEHTPSVLLLNEKTLKWKWETTLDKTYRKKKVQYGSVEEFLTDLPNIKEDAEINHNFYKVVVQDKIFNLKKLAPDQYNKYIILDKLRVDITNNTQNKAVVSKIVENLSKSNVSENLLQFVLNNNTIKEYEDSIKSVYATYERKID